MLYLQPPPRTSVGVETLAVEHLCLLDMADATMVTGVGVTGVVAALAHPAAIEHVTAFLPQVVHLVVHVQEADAALQAGGSCSMICHPEGTEDKVGEGFYSRGQKFRGALQAPGSGCARQQGVKKPPRPREVPLHHDPPATASAGRLCPPWALCPPQRQMLRHAGQRPSSRTHAAIWSSGAPPMNRSVSRLSPSVPAGLSPLTWGSPSTDKRPLRRLRFTTNWCHLPGSTRTLLAMVTVPEPVLNLEQKRGRPVSVPPC